MDQGTRDTCLWLLRKEFFNEISRILLHNIGFLRARKRNRSVEETYYFDITSIMEQLFHNDEEFDFGQGHEAFMGIVTGEPLEKEEPEYSYGRTERLFSSNSSDDRSRSTPESVRPKRRFGR